MAFNTMRKYIKLTRLVKNMKNEKAYPPIVQVDDLGSVIGPIMHDEAHMKNRYEKGVRHATVNCFVFRDESYAELLISKREQNKLSLFLIMP